MPPFSVGKHLTDRATHGDLCGDGVCGVSAHFLGPADHDSGHSPGSLTEMSITAENLGLGVAGVAAFQIVRLFIMVPLTPYCTGWQVRASWVREMA